MFVLTCNIKIGNIEFDAVNSVEIDRSIYRLGDRATIKIPTTALLTQSGEPTTKVETAGQFNVGDTVTISLGYDNSNELEFIGYVKAINIRTPIEIECEDEFYQLRNKSTTLSGNTTIKQIFDKLGLTTGKVEDLTIKNFVCQNMTYFQIIARLEQDYGLLIYFDLDKKIYATSVGAVKENNIKYILRENVISDNSLQYRRAEDVKIKVDFICYKKDGTQVKASVGNGEATETVYFYDVENETELKKLAEIELKRRSYDGYDGEIETFLQPYCKPCDIAVIEDKLYNERSGSYLITAVKTTFGVDGARRLVNIGLKV